MPTPLIPTGAFAGPRAALSRFLVHSCDYTPITAATVDGDEVASRGTTVTIACKYREQGQAIRDATGLVVVSGPTLKVAPTVALAVGGEIANIRDSGGEVLIAGPLTVQRRLDNAGLGLPLLRSYELHGADPGRAS